MKEETDLDIEIGELFFEMEDINPGGKNRKHYYYLCEYKGGEPKLNEDSEEALEMKKGINSFKPVWVDILKLNDFSLFPNKIKSKIIETFI